MSLKKISCRFLVTFKRQFKNTKKEQLMEQSKGISFKGQNIYVGIDVHLKSWSVTILSETSVLKKMSQGADPDALHRFLTSHYPEAEYYSVYEAGFCGFWIHDRLTELGIHNIVVNPADVPTMSSEKLRKTDAVDSKKLAVSLRAKQLKGIYTPDSETLEIRSLIRLKNSITKDMTRQKNRIKSQLRYLGIEIPTEYLEPYSNWSKRFLSWLKQVSMRTPSGRQTLDILIMQFEALRRQKAEMTRKLRLLSHTERFEETLELLMTVPGIGQTTGLALMAEIVDITRFANAEQLAAYVGMIPMCHSSGEHEGVGDITLRKHAILRSNIIEAAWVAIRKDEAMQLCYLNNCKRMVASKAIVKVARKLVNRIYFVLKRHQPYVNAVA